MSDGSNPSNITTLGGGQRPALPGWVLGIVGTLGFLTLWEIVSRTGLIERRYFPPASEVLLQAGRNLGDPIFWTAVQRTMTGWALGLSIATVAAIVLGMVIGSNRFLREATHSTIEFLRPIPSVAWIPLAVLLFGTSLQSTLLLVVYAAFWQILIQVLYGVGDVDPVASETARSFQFNRISRMRYVVWPTALPYVMTGLRLGAAVALILAVTAELVIGGGGLGQRIALAQSGGAIPQMYALVLATGLIGVAVNLATRALERKVLGWHVSVRGEVAL